MDRHLNHAEKGDIAPEHLEMVLDDTANARQSHYRPRSDEEKRLDRWVNLKLDCVVVVILALAFIFCGIDKTAVGYVATSRFLADAHVTADDIANSLSLFSATYVPLQLPMAILARRVGVKPFLAAQLTLWGGLCMCHAAIRGPGTLIALRLLIGAAEAGFTQIGMYYMSTLYPKYSVGLRFAAFTGMYSIAYGLLQIETVHIHGWQVVFLLEGGTTVVLGVASLLFLPSSLGKAWFLTAEERRHAVRRMEVDLAGTQEEADMQSTAVTRRDVLDVARDWKKLLIVLCNVTTVLPVTAFTTFLPLVVQGMGYEGNKATLMSVSPFVAGVLGLLIVTWSSDRREERSLHTVTGMGLGVVGLIVMAASENTVLRFVFAHVCLAGVFVGGPLMGVWLAGNTPWKGARIVVLGMNGWSNIAGVVAGQIFRSKYAPRYETSLVITIAIMVLGAAGLVFVRTMYKWENKKREREIAGWDEQQFADEAASEVRRGDQRRTFMYGL